jgi:selenocysteine lyase/cysteine desulfurase
VVSLARRVSALVSLDAAHFAPHQPIDVAALDVDLLFFSIYKCFGPHMGGVYIRRALCEALVPYGPHTGGPGARGADRLETGTRNLEAYAGWLGTIAYLERLGRAAAPLIGGDVATRRQALQVAMCAIAAWEGALTEHGDAQLAALPGLELYRQAPSDPRPRLGVFSFNVRGRTPVEVAQALEHAAIEAVVGNNGAVRTMARLARDFGEIGVRLSIAHYNTREDLDRAIACVASLVAR